MSMQEGGAVASSPGKKGENALGTNAGGNGVPSPKLGGGQSTRHPHDSTKSAIHLKTNHNTSFYSIEQASGVDHVQKPKTWKARRKKVKTCYKVPEEDEDPLPFTTTEEIIREVAGD